MNDKDKKYLIKWLNQINKLLDNHTTMGSILAQDKVKRLIKTIETK